MSQVPGNDEWDKDYSNSGKSHNGSFAKTGTYAPILNDLIKTIKDAGNINIVTIDLILRQDNPGAQYTKEAMDFVGQGIIDQTEKYLREVGKLNVTVKGTYKYEEKSGNSSIRIRTE